MFTVLSIRWTVILAPRLGALLMELYDFLALVFLVTICIVAIKA